MSKCPRCTLAMLAGVDEWGEYMHCGWCGVYVDYGEAREGKSWMAGADLAPFGFGVRGPYRLRTGRIAHAPSAP